LIRNLGFRKKTKQLIVKQVIKAEKQYHSVVKIWECGKKSGLLSHNQWFNVFFFKKRFYI